MDDVQTAGGWALHHGPTPYPSTKRRGRSGRAGGWPALATADASGGGKAITLALVGGHRLLRDATANILAAESGLQVLGAFASAAHYRALVSEHQPDVLLIDCDENDDWQRAVETLSTPSLRSRLALLCGVVREEIIRCAIEQRVSGVIQKSYTPRETRDAIAYIATGRTVMPVGWQRVFDRAAGKPLGLSPRHRQILALIAQGRGSEEIAAELRLSRNTVKFHTRELYARLGVHNRVEAANQYALMTCGED